MARRGRRPGPPAPVAEAPEAPEGAVEGRPSRSEKKRARRLVGEAGHDTAEALVRLTRGSVLRLRLPEPVEAAVLEHQRLGRNPAAARQLRFLARLLREAGLADIELRLRLLREGLPLPPRGGAPGAAAATGDDEPAPGDGPDGDAAPGDGAAPDAAHHAGAAPGEEDAAP